MTNTCVTQNWSANGEHCEFYDHPLSHRKHNRAADLRLLALLRQQGALEETADDASEGSNEQAIRSILALREDDLNARASYRQATLVAKEVMQLRKDPALQAQHVELQNSVRLPPRGHCTVQVALALVAT